jgi:predicted metal-dependent enzyme (double-stranded beta helix superfamily)
MIGMLRGSEEAIRYGRTEPTDPLQPYETAVLNQGDIDLVSPTLGDVHRVRNVYDDRVSISIHVYGANIGSVRRHVYDDTTGNAKEFVSGFSSDVVPNLWKPTETGSRSSNR